MNNKNLFLSKKAFSLYAMIGFIVLFSILSRIDFFVEYIFARGISRFLATVLNFVFGFIPFSVGEFIFIAILLYAIVYIVIIIVQLFKRNPRLAFKKLYTLTMVILSVILFVNLTISFLYNRKSVITVLDLPNETINLNLAEDSAKFYIDLANAYSKKISLSSADYNFSLEQLSNKINAEYDKLTNDYFNKFKVNAKPFLFSEFISYLGLSGMYFPFTAEANINTNSPKYQLPVTIAHEIAHAKGVLKENEANFLAYYICLNSSDDFLRYSGAMYAASITLNAVKSFEGNHHNDLFLLLNNEVKIEYMLANRHYDKYDGFISSLSTFFNNLFLKSNGISDGVASYSRTAAFLTNLYIKFNGEVIV